MIKSILVTGLILGNETGMCSCKNINLNWLFERPSDLLWADKIILTNNEWKAIIQPDESAISRALNLIFDRLKEEGMIQIIPDTIIDSGRAESILQNVESDLQVIKDLFSVPQNKKNIRMKMGQYHFCVPSLCTLYAAIEISRCVNASFSLEQDELAYLSALIPRKYEKEIMAGRNMAMDEVLNLYLPSVKLGHDYLFDSEKGRCSYCVHFDQCSGSFLSVIEKQLEDIIRIRQYDEIRRTCEVMDELCERSTNNGHVLTGDELWDDLQEEANKTLKKVRRVLPKVKFWSKISTYVSVGISAASFLNPLIAVGAAVPAITSQCLTSYGDNLEKEASWANFVNDPDYIME